MPILIRAALPIVVVLCLAACGPSQPPPDALHAPDMPATPGAAPVATGTDTAAVASASGIISRDAWIRALPPIATVAGGYVTLANGTAVDDVLVGVDSGAAARVEIHAMSMEGDVMRMRKLGDGVPLPRGEDVALAPGGLHLMFIAPTASLQAGDRVEATLRFAHAAPQPVVFEVRGVDGQPAQTGDDASTPPAAGDGGHGGHDDHMH